MTWEEHLEILNESTIKELDDKIAELTDENRDRACQAMNEIHWVLALAQTDKQRVEKIEELEREFHDKSFGPILPWRLKRMKEKYELDPVTYEKEWENIQEFSAKIRAEGIDDESKGEDKS